MSPGGRQKQFLQVFNFHFLLIFLISLLGVKHRSLCKLTSLKTSDNLKQSTKAQKTREKQKHLLCSDCKLKFLVICIPPVTACDVETLVLRKFGKTLQDALSMNQKALQTLKILQHLDPRLSRFHNFEKPISIVYMLCRPGHFAAMQTN